MKCTFSYTIQVPPNAPTEIHVEIFNANMSSSPALIIGRPRVTFGSDFNTGLDYAVYPDMNSNYSDSRVKYSISNISFYLFDAIYI